ncbi:MAG: hypothetical protein FJ125_09815, partial [Deltaproteobacteria bacterium]|nr:hypothetical protein [Deltaproteobacteria bacterium]
MIRGLPRGAVLLELLLLASPAAAQVVPEAMPGTGTVQPGPGPAGSPDAAEAPDGSAAPAAAMAPAVAPPPSPASSGTWTLEQARRAYLQARQLLHEQLHEEAQRLLADVLVRVPTWSLPKLALAQSLRAQSRNRDERERLLVEASAVDPENHQISYELGLVHEEADRRQEAIRCYRQAVARRPDMIHAQERLGVL